MTLRIQIFGIIVALALLIIVTGVGSGMFLMRSGVVRLEEESLRDVAALADTLVRGKLDFLKLGAKLFARRSADTITYDDDGNEIVDVRKIEEVLQRYTGVDFGFHDSVDYSALTAVEKVVGNDGKESYKIIASYGDFPVPQSELDKKAGYITRTFEGYPVLSTTVPTGRTVKVSVDGKDQDLPEIVFFVCTPLRTLMEEEKWRDEWRDKHGEGSPLPAQPATRILCATLDGTYFSRILKSSRIWSNDSDVLICDNEGTMVASSNFPRVTHVRTNYIELAKMYPDKFGDLAEFTKLMIDVQKKIQQQMSEGQEVNEGDISGHHRHFFNGEWRIAFFRPVESTVLGFTLAVSAPTASSPFQGATRWGVIISAICVALSCVAAFFASGFLEKPYKIMARAKHHAERASESKSSFLANMSHEMRTPLNAIIGLSELTISSGDAKGEVAVNLEKIYNASITLLGTINDLLDISKIEAGRFELIPVEYDVPSLINDTAALNTVRIGSKPIQFTLVVDEKLPSRFSFRWMSQKICRADYSAMNFGSNRFSIICSRMP
jgi:hypothetical protein